MSDWIIKPMLAESEADLTSISTLLGSIEWRAEQKIDGVRLMVHVHEGRVHGVNRKGTMALVPPQIAAGFQALVGEWAFDGELVKGVYWVFDMPRALNVCSINHPYSTRRELLEGLWPKLDMPDCVKLLPSYIEPRDCADLANRVYKNNGEGLIFKRNNAKYSPGRRTRDSVKWKFVKDIDCIVMEIGIDNKRNFSVGLVDNDGDVIEVATVSALTGEGSQVQIGDVVTVRFLYVSEDNRLVQPTLPMLRRDKSPYECTFDQLASFKVNKEVVG